MTPQKEPKLTRVKDQLSQWHKLTKELGKGGQGIVYRTSDPELLVKMPLKNHKEITDKAEVKYFQEQLERLYLLPLTNTMHITRPLYLLEEQAGYVMQMMQDMQPIGEWLPQILNKQLAKTFTRPAWLSDDVPLESAYSLAMYAKSGGTKRRLELLAQATIELLRLHSVGVIFMDVSPDNIYCSISSEYCEVWMIDADNLRFEAVNAKSGVITPQYGAPEIVRGESGARVVSDAYSLALLAFKILTMSGAFDGQRFRDSLDDEDDWAADESVSVGLSLEVQAEQGELPFIFVSAAARSRVGPRQHDERTVGWERGGACMTRTSKPSASSARDRLRTRRGLRRRAGRARRGRRRSRSTRAACRRYEGAPRSRLLVDEVDALAPLAGFDDGRVVRATPRRWRRPGCGRGRGAACSREATRRVERQEVAMSWRMPVSWLE